MIIIRIAEVDGGAAVTVRGHSERAEKGKDIVCAAISALANALAKAAGWEQAGIADDDGDVVYITSRSIGFKTVLKAVSATMEEIAGQYPEDVKVVRS